MSEITALVIAQRHMLVGGLLVLFANSFDTFDGAMAQILNAATNFGAFLDSTLDGYSESIIQFGLPLVRIAASGPTKPIQTYAC